MQRKTIFKMTVQKTFLIFFLSTLLSAQDIKIKIQNATTNKLGKANKATLILLQNGMQILTKIQNPEGRFTFKNIKAPENFPLLVQINYKNTNYNKIIPPVPSIREKEQEILIYEISNSIQNLKIKSLMQITKKKEFFEVLKVFLIRNENTPQTTYFNAKKPIKIHIPQNAESISAFVRQPSSNMGIPIALGDTPPDGKNFNRSILPGVTELEVIYNLPLTNNTIKDRIFFGNTNERIIFFRPKNLETSFKNIQKEKISSINENVPENTKVARLLYPKNKTIEINIQPTNSFWEENITEVRNRPTPRTIINGHWFDSIEKSIFGILAVLSFLFSTFFILVKIS